MRLTTFNVENLFARPRVFHRGDWDEGKDLLDAYAKTSALLEEPEYTPPIKSRIVQGLRDLRLASSDGNKFVRLRQNRGRLVTRGSELKVVADGRADWVGWLEFEMKLSSETAVQNTARVLSELDPDVAVVVEADNRPALKRFSDDFIPAAAGPGQSFDHVMLIDGNDARGIDVGFLSQFPIKQIASHVDDDDGNGVVFSRDCPEFLVKTKRGHNLLVIGNHLKSKGYGSAAASNSKRERQARRVAEIYRRRRKEFPYVAVVGDFNDTPDSGPLSPLFSQTGLRDVSEHPSFDDGAIAGFDVPGTWGPGYKGNKIDLVLLSPSLFAKVDAAGAFRGGVFDKRVTPKWTMFDTITGPEDAASDHAAIWAELRV